MHHYVSQGFLSIKLQHAGLRVQNIDPPVLTVNNFLPPNVCDSLIQAAEASGKMKQSGIGGTGDLKDDIRTSSTLAITKEVLQDCPDIKQPLQQLLDAAVQLLGDRLDKSAIQNMQFVRPSGPQQLAPELPQIAHYLPGELLQPSIFRSISQQQRVVKCTHQLLQHSFTVEYYNQGHHQINRIRELISTWRCYLVLPCCRATCWSGVLYGSGEQWLTGHQTSMWLCTAQGSSIPASAEHHS